MLTQNLMLETIITSFPGRWDGNSDDTSHVHRHIRHLVQRRTFRDAFDLGKPYIPVHQIGKALSSANWQNDSVILTQ